MKCELIDRSMPLIAAFMQCGNRMLCCEQIVAFEPIAVSILHLISANWYKCMYVHSPFHTKLLRCIANDFNAFDVSREILASESTDLPPCQTHVSGPRNFVLIIIAVFQVVAMNIRRSANLEVHRFITLACTHRRYFNQLLLVLFRLLTLKEERCWLFVCCCACF